MNNLIIPQNLYLDYGVLSTRFIENTSPPIICDWDYTNSISRKDVKIWELVYDDPYNVGLYASWSPYIEFYIFVFYNFSEEDKRFCEFYGRECYTNVKYYLERYGIELEINDVKLN